ncbi:rcc01693 family protein [Cucumibacter marinus]|uniref:rcc01693 family protein n=1 Tax=Cucumibacter marinus TaxID=1121252 RepID=UPI00040F7692|nr:rcc01693 family protein [Cucumibacter marinus]
MTSFPWSDAMALAFGHYRLSPSEFWALTPRELLALAEAAGWATETAMTRQVFDDLMTRYPDEIHD